MAEEQNETVEIHAPTARLAIKFIMLNTWIAEAELETDPGFIRQLVLDAFPDLKAFDDHICEVEGDVIEELSRELNEIEALITLETGE